ncbi:MAG: sigma-54-dependent Fis family transcriptional regulator [Ignavibacteria bacterium]|nr:sigma-54-dependent Fis family transcriptional regulator [Ignavibacteria bacterium]
MALQKYSIVIIEDDPLVNATVRDILASKYARVHGYTDPVKGIDELDSTQPDLILLDIFLGHMNGLDILEEIRAFGYTMPVVMMTAFSDIKMAVRAMKLGAEDFIVKPLDLEQLEIAVEKSLANYDLRRQVNLLEERLRREESTEIIGNSEGIRRALQIGQIVASADDTTALILGESGTGKELIAKYIHQRSARSKGPFITINCGAIPRELAENELFGYEKGAFTGATEKVKQGRFEQANHGTILLDEVGELSPEMQVKLLRVLQERTFYRLGGMKEVSVDVRVIAATNRNLEQLVEEGKFREDLYYRLNVAIMTLPPLRERRDDILELATSFVNEFNKKFGRKITGFTPEAADLMESYQWRGNIRELRNVIERVVLLETGTVISKESLNFLRPPSAPTAGSRAAMELAPGQHFLQISKEGAQMSDVLKDFILQTLKITGGNQIKAAKILQISRAKLRYRIEQLGIIISQKSIT